MGYRCCFNIPACIYLLPLQRSNFTETQPYRWRGPGPNKPSPPSLLFNSHLDRQRQSPKPLGSRRRTRRLSTSSSSHRLLPFLGFLLRRRQSGGGGIMTQIREPVLLEVGWKQMEAGTKKLERILDDEPGVAFKSDEYMKLYTYEISPVGPAWFFSFF